MRKPVRGSLQIDDKGRATMGQVEEEVGVTGLVHEIFVWVLFAQTHLKLV